MGKYKLIRRALLLLGAGVCVRAVVWALTLIYAVRPGAAALLLLGCVGVLMMAAGNWRDSDEAERYYTDREARRRKARGGRRAR